MRLARARDYGRWLLEKAVEWPFQIERIVFEDIPSLGTGEIVLSAPIGLLAGPNGVGKTTLLKAVWAALAPPDGNLTGPTALKLSAGKITIEFREDDARASKTATFAAGQVTGTDGLDREVLHIDTADAVREQQKEFCEFEDLEDLINGVGVRAVTAPELVEINYLSRRDYREINVYEVEGTHGILPFFEVAYGNDRYDSRTMGAGELAVLYLWWSIARAAAGSLVLVEEPETYLSPASQEALCHYILAAAYDEKLCFLITSHSAKVISALPSATQNYLYRSAGAIRVVEGLPPPAILETIGINIPVDTLLLVEDEAAAILLRQILEKFDTSLSRRSEIKICDGSGKIVSKLKEVGGISTAIKIAGVFDGDMREADIGQAKSYAAYLPGEEPIENAFRQLVSNNADAFRQAMGSDDIPAILFGLQGADLHDWYAGLCGHLGLTKAQLFPTLFRMWINAEGNSEAAQKCVADVYSVLVPPKKTAT